MKVGTAVVTRTDGRLALGRIGALCEQVSMNTVKNPIFKSLVVDLWFLI